MTSDKQDQLELFSQHNDQEQAGSFSKTFLSYIGVYEKTIMILIGFLVIGIVSYCFGVERGKNIAAVSRNTRIDMATIGRSPVVPRGAPKAVPSALKPPQQPVSVPKVIVVPAPVLNAKGTNNAVAAVKVASRSMGTVPVTEASSAQRYTIQIGTFQARTNAQKDIAILRQAGLSPVLVSQGKYSVLCVGAFSNQETARSLLVELKKKYRDCYIRRL
jgi:cell division septation protein DedD